MVFVSRWGVAPNEFFKLFWWNRQPVAEDEARDSVNKLAAVKSRTEKKQVSWKTKALRSAEGNCRIWRKQLINLGFQIQAYIVWF